MIPKTTPKKAFQPLREMYKEVLNFKRNLTGGLPASCALTLSKNHNPTVDDAGADMNEVFVSLAGRETIKNQL